MEANGPDFAARTHATQMEFLLGAAVQAGSEAGGLGALQLGAAEFAAFARRASGLLRGDGRLAGSSTIATRPDLAAAALLLPSLLGGDLDVQQLQLGPAPLQQLGALLEEAKLVLQAGSLESGLDAR